MNDLPSLPYEEWRDTRDTLHRWMQIVGKVRLGLTPRFNHWWNVPFYVSAHGLTTSAIPYRDRRFEMEFDFVEHVLRIRPEDGPMRFVDLRPRTVADFYRATMHELHAAGIECRIWTMPVEIERPVAFEHDTDHRSYDWDQTHRFWQIVSRTDDVLAKFRAGFLGKCSPVHFFWGSFDLACSRFSGRRAPPFEASSIEREAYSHEVCSAGWWPGDYRHEHAAFYSYIAPEPAEYSSAKIATPHAYYNPTLKGFYLEHADVQAAADPEALLLDFFDRTYVAAANLAKWPRLELERDLEDTRHDAMQALPESREPSRKDDRLRGVPAERR